jgi:hypothetical protein
LDILASDSISSLLMSEAPIIFLSALLKFVLRLSSISFSLF